MKGEGKSGERVRLCGRGGAGGGGEDCVGWGVDGVGEDWAVLEGLIWAVCVCVVVWVASSYWMKMGRRGRGGVVNVLSRVESRGVMVLGYHFKKESGWVIEYFMVGVKNKCSISIPFIDPSLAPSARCRIPGTE